MTLGRYLLRRALFALLLTVIVSSATLLLTLMTPGDFGTDNTFEDPAVMAARRAQLGLDRPIVVQYFDWIGRAARFDFGQSLLYTRPVNQLLRERALNTAVLAAAALGLATIVMLSMPPLLATLAMVLVAARTGWFPVGGMSSPGASEMTWTMWLADLARHVPLPAIALALPLAATLERLQSQSLRDAIAQPFVLAAEARGVSRDRAVLAHAWRVSLAPVLGLYGLMIGTLFSGSFVVEVVSGWPGLGRLMYDGLRARDLYLVAGCAATGALFLAIGTFVADLLLAVADPRVRLDKA
jgi:peptide/nickel transport system permease protein